MTSNISQAIGPLRFGDRPVQGIGAFVAHPNVSVEHVELPAARLPGELPVGRVPVAVFDSIQGDAFIAAQPAGHRRLVCLPVGQRVVLRFGRLVDEEKTPASRLLKIGARSLRRAGPAVRDRHRETRGVGVPAKARG